MNGKRFSTLLKLNLNNYFKPKFQDAKAKKKYFVTLAILAVVMLIPVAELVFVIYTLASSAVDGGYCAEIISSLFVVTQVATFLMGLVAYMQTMYFSKDNDFLSTLPISTTEIFLSKVVTVIIMQMLISAITVIPSTIVTAVVLASAGQVISASYYILIPISVITLPMLPILIIAIFSFPVMKIAAYFKKHPTLSAVFTVFLIVALVAAIYIPLYSNIYSDEAMNSENPTIISEDMINTLKTLGQGAIHTFALANAMLGSNVGINLLIYFGITIAAFVIGILCAVLLYKSTLSMMSEGGAVKRAAKVGHEFDAEGLNKTLFIREFKSLVREPQRFINMLMAVVLTPVMVFIMMYVMNMAAQTAEGDSGAIGSLFIAGLGTMLTMMMMGGSNVGVSAGYSMEGKYFSILKTLPVPYSKLFKMKLWVNELFDIAGIIVTAVIITVYAKLNVIDVIGYVVCCTLYVMAINAFALKRDLKNPKLNWTNIKEVTKNNFNTLIPLLLSMGGGILAMILSIVFGLLTINPYLASLLYWVSVLIVAGVYFLIFRKGIYTKVDKMFEEVEC